MKTFFDNSTEDAVAALLNLSEDNFPKKITFRLADLIEKARREGR